MAPDTNIDTQMCFILMLASEWKYISNFRLNNGFAVTAINMKIFFFYFC